MSLTKTDLDLIRDIVIDGVQVVTEPHFDLIESDIQAMREAIKQIKADILTIRSDISGLQSRTVRQEEDLSLINGRVTAINNDVIEIYKMLKEPKLPTKLEREFNKLSVEKQILLTYRNTLITAKQMGVTLPRS